MAMLSGSINARNINIINNLQVTTKAPNEH
jgi:hypothetical protein